MSRSLDTALTRDTGIAVPLLYQQYFQAGRSVDGIERVESAGAIVRRFAEAASARDGAAPRA